MHRGGNFAQELPTVESTGEKRGMGRTFLILAVLGSNNRQCMMLMPCALKGTQDRY